MQHLKTLLGATLMFTALQAQADLHPQTNDITLSTGSEAQPIEQSSNVRTAVQQKDTKRPVARTQPKATSQKPYEVPLSDYNNGGHFGN